jgi:hypothetical protein
MRYKDYFSYFNNEHLMESKRCLNENENKDNFIFLGICSKFKYNEFINDILDRHRE